MSKQYREHWHRQTILLPPSMEDWLPEGHLGRFVMDVVEEIDLSPIESVVQRKDPRGTRPYSPQMMVGLLFYAYATGRFSSRRIARGCVEDVALRLISRDTKPHFTSIADFRRVHLAALAELFQEVLRLCREAGLVRGVDVWADGTKVKANASKHKAMSYAGMKEREERLAREIDEILKRAEQDDAKEDAEFGAGKDEGASVADEIKRRETRKEWIRKTREALEAEAREARAAELRELAAANRHRHVDEKDPSQAKGHQTRAEKQMEKADELDPEPKDLPPPPPRTSPSMRRRRGPMGPPPKRRNATSPSPTARS